MAPATYDHRDRGCPAAGPIRAAAQRRQQYRAEGHAAAARAAAVVPSIRARGAAPVDEVGQQDPVHGPHRGRVHHEVEIPDEQLVRCGLGSVEELPGGTGQVGARDDEVRSLCPGCDAVCVQFECRAGTIDTDLSRNGVVIFWIVWSCCGSRTLGTFPNWLS